MDLDSFLVSLYVLVDDWWRERHPPSVPNKPGRPALLCESEVLTPSPSSPSSGPASAAKGTSGASLGRICALSSPSCAPKANSTGASEPCSPSCASCSGTSPRILPSLRPSTV